ncbi:MAG TPA: hypothetical protein VG984_03365 [Candidatus Paceibacterota bacterium]|nr:hypothetical protein [Candidatus Paceibacterota bacterium]
MRGKAKNPDPRPANTKAKILAATRVLMNMGTFTPTREDIAEIAGVDVRSIFNHYRRVEILYLEVLASEPGMPQKMAAALLEREGFTIDSNMPTSETLEKVIGLIPIIAIRTRCG